MALAPSGFVRLDISLPDALDNVAVPLGLGTLGDVLVAFSFDHKARINTTIAIDREPSRFDPGLVERPRFRACLAYRGPHRATAYSRLMDVASGASHRNAHSEP